MDGASLPDTHGLPLMAQEAGDEERHAQHQKRPSSTPRATRMVHMDTVETTRVNRVSPAARRAWGSVKEVGQSTTATRPWSQMIWRAYRSASSETL